MFDLQTLGEFRLLWNGETVDLPPSRKVRGLLGYLAVSGRKHRRDHLSDLLWAESLDPKGSLRWALSRLRAVFDKIEQDESQRWRIVADRDAVQLECAGGTVDFLEAKKSLSHPADFSLSDLIDVEKKFKGRQFSGLEMLDQPSFEAWRVRQADEAEDLYSKLLHVLVERLGDDPDAALPFARKAAKLEGQDQAAHARLIELLLQAGRPQEAEAHLAIALAQLKQVDPADAHHLEAHWQRLKSESGDGIQHRSPSPPLRSDPVRKNTTILAADVVGFSRHMGNDETGTLEALRTLRENVWDPHIGRHGGTVYSTAGDGLVAGFDKPDLAVKASLAMQEDMADKDQTALNAPIEQRIGVHKGPVLFVDHDVLGAPIAIADALQRSCTIGGVVISDVVRDALPDPLKDLFDQVGELHFEDFETSVISYGWTPERLENGPHTSALSVQTIKRPCVAVLPFANLSGDITQDYIGQGLADDLITELTKFRWFDVVARDSSFAYQDRAANTQLIASELDVDYILEGSVRMAGPRIRVSAQLIDGDTGRLVWTDQFDGSMDAIFDFKDEITDHIVGSIEPELSHVERERAVGKKIGSLELWDVFQKAVWHLTRFNPDDMMEADRLFQDVVQRDPNFHRGHAYIAVLRYLSILVGDPREAESILEDGERHGRHAVSLDFYDPLGHYALGLVLLARRQLNDAMFEFQTALDLNPRFVYANYGMALALRGIDKSAEAADHFQRVIKLSPRDPILWSAHWGLAFAYLLDGQYDKAEHECAQARQYPETGYWPDITQVALFVAKGQKGKAQDELAKCLETWPGLTRGQLYSQARILSAEGPAFDRFLDMLEEAGLPCDG